MLTACGSPAPPIVLRPPAASLTPGAVDGRYRGTVRLVRAAGPYCTRSGARVLEISGSTISLSYNVAPRQRVSLTAQVASDGRIQVANGRLEITVASRQCEHRWTLVRVD